jgi:hypothetical protein
MMMIKILFIEFSDYPSHRSYGPDLMGEETVLREISFVLRSDTIGSFICVLERLDDDQMATSQRNLAASILRRAVTYKRAILHC